jgi:hypothetical protein
MASMPENVAPTVHNHGSEKLEHELSGKINVVYYVTPCVLVDTSGYFSF